MVEILVVDDEAAIADLVEVCLKNEGYTVYKCGSGEAALTCVARQHLDLAILDVMLPDLDGFTLCQKIREEHLFPILPGGGHGQDHGPDPGGGRLHYQAL